jgi:hypothetical protein
MQTVPLVIYSQTGERKVIGTADVEEVGGELVIVGHITDPKAEVLLNRDINLAEGAEFDYSLTFKGSIGLPLRDEMIEAIQYPVPVNPKEKDR